MKRTTCCWLILVISVTPNLFEEYLCADTNTTTVIYISSEESLGKLNSQIELKLNSSNQNLLSQIATLNARYDEMLNKFTEAQNVTGRQVDLLNSSNEILLSQIKMLIARFDELNGMSTKIADRQNLVCSIKPKYPSNCAEVDEAKPANGVYFIKVYLFGEEPFQVLCNATHDGGWTVIQRRQDGSVDFYRDWAEYRKGFGSLDGEFFIGLDKLHALTAEKPQELFIVMSDFEGVTTYAQYDAFAIGDEYEDFALKVLGKYSGNAGDSLSYHVGQKFSTKDRDNDEYTGFCAQLYKGAWWYKDCHTSNLNGLYLSGRLTDDMSAKGIIWVDWHGNEYSLKHVEMMIRPKRN